jgi:Abortive infection alpha
MSNSNIKDTADVVKGIVEAVPVYQDMLQPAAKELGKGVHTLSKLVNIALTPVSAMVWGYDQIKEYVQTSLEQKLKETPQEDIVHPDLTVAGPALEALRFTGHKEELREMFSNLLATAMDRKKATNAHPSFVDIIKQISPDEAKILQMLDGKTPIPIIKIRIYGNPSHAFAEPLINFSVIPYDARCSNPELGPSFLENITRLGLTNISYDTYNVNPNAYDIIENHPIINEWKDHAKNLDKRIEISRGALTRTAFGEKFYNSCVIL